MKSPIGIFDSGIGGLSIWKEIHSLMPNESTLYFSDGKNSPYGEKSKSEIIDNIQIAHSGMQQMPHGFVIPAWGHGGGDFLFIKNNK